MRLQSSLAACAALFLLLLGLGATSAQVAAQTSINSDAALGAADIKLPPGVTRVTTVEGITEYRLQNGLRILLVPDQSQQVTTVNITYLVGSHQESYGETGMAHLL